jgi:hypothetical protein
MSQRVAIHRILPLAAVVLSGLACATNPPPETPMAHERELTLGLVQREVRTGVTGADVVSALGSPNQVTLDGDRREVWVYDRVSSERAETVESGSVVGAVAGTAGTASGVTAGQASRKNTRERTSQKTLTVVIRFDAEARVSTVTVHSTRF